MAGNRDVVEVLHFVGAHDSFIASEFQRHFMWLGLKGGFRRRRGGCDRVRLAHVLAARLVATAGAMRSSDVRVVTVGWQGYAAIVVAWG